MKKVNKVIITVVAPLLLGMMIYLLSRPTSLVGYQWLLEKNLLAHAPVLKQLIGSTKFPNIILYNLPDFLWIFAFTSLMNLIWHQGSKRNTLLYALSPILIAFIHEIGQGFSIINGTFDPLDLLFYAAGSAVSMLLYGFSRRKMKKQLKHVFSAIGIAVFIGFALASNNETSKKEDKEELIYRYASDYVKQRLDSPEDAIFPDLSEGLNHLVHISEEEYYINSWVDTPEGKRMNYNCRVIIKKDYIGIQDLEIEYTNKPD